MADRTPVDPDVWLPAGWVREGGILRHVESGAGFMREPDGRWWLDTKHGSFDVGECPSPNQWRRFVEARRAALENAMDVIDHWKRKVRRG